MAYKIRRELTAMEGFEYVEEHIVFQAWKKVTISKLKRDNPTASIGELNKMFTAIKLKSKEYRDLSKAVDKDVLERIN